MTKWDAKRWAHAKRDLESCCPTSKPVRVVRVRSRASDDGEHWYGDCVDRGDNYLIRINRADPVLVAIDTLIHEYAHAMADHVPSYRRCHHDSLWGVCYAMAYCAAYATT